jgi:SAM-dependent methyltransferase
MKLDPTLPWRCPTCHEVAEVVETDTETRFRCSAAHHFATVDGVPCLCQADNYADSFGFEWLAHSRTQMDKFNGTHISRDRFFEFTGWPRDLSGETVLEAGSGSGRFTQVLLDAGARVVSFDYSAAVRANLENNGASERLTLFRGDVFNIPMAEGTFDRVVCLGVLQHTPDPARAFASLARMVKPGGAFAVDIYRLALVSLLCGKYYLRAALRPFRSSLPDHALMGVVRRAVPVLLPMKAAVRRVPVLGVPLAHVFVPVPDYRGRLPLTDAQCATWSELDLFDWLSPAHDHPATRGTVERWCRKAQLTDVSIEVVSKGGQLAIRGRRPVAA